MLKIEEISCLIHSVNLNKEGRTRTFPAITLPLVAGLMKKVRALGDADGKILAKECELDLSTDEKKFVKDLVNELEWPAGDGEFVLGLIEKLS